MRFPGNAVPMTEPGGATSGTAIACIATIVLEFTKGHIPFDTDHIFTIQNLIGTVVGSLVALSTTEAKATIPPPVSTATEA